MEKYRIKCETNSWLSKPGLVVYIEDESESFFSHVMLWNIDRLKSVFRGLHRRLLFFPSSLARCDDALHQYMTGKVDKSNRYRVSQEYYKEVLSVSVYNQIEGPTLLFTGSDENGFCEAFRMVAP